MKNKLVSISFELTLHMAQKGCGSRGTGVDADE